MHRFISFNMSRRQFSVIDGGRNEDPPLYEENDQFEFDYFAVQFPAIFDVTEIIKEHRQTHGFEDYIDIDGSTPQKKVRVMMNKPPRYVRIEDYGIYYWQKVQVFYQTIVDTLGETYIEEKDVKREPYDWLAKMPVITNNDQEMIERLVKSSKDCGEKVRMDRRNGSINLIVGDSTLRGLVEEVRERINQVLLSGNKD